MKKLLALSCAASMACAVGHAQTNRVFNNAGGDNLWSNAANWSGGAIADTISERTQLNGSPIVDQNFSISRITSNFGATVDPLISGSGILTLDASTGTTDGILNNSNNGVTMRFLGNVTVNHGSNGTTKFSYSNGTGNGITFEDGSELRLDTVIETATGTTQFLDFNGRIVGGTGGVAGIRVAAGDTNVRFGATADNSGYAGDIVMFNGSSIISESAVSGGFLRAGSKVQVNGATSSLTLNGANSMEGNIVIAGGRSLTLNANADQALMGFVNLDDGSNLNLVLDNSVSEFAFASSASIAWGTGSISIAGFRENTVRFGTDATGLTQDQLDAIDGGIYSLTDQGYLSIPEPGSFSLLFGAMGAVSILRRRR